ncbi:ABC transporter permease [Sphingobacterium hungaricum]
MRLPLFFAKRYLFSKKSVNAINIISGISVVGVLVSSAALVIVLSFYNGMEKFILSQYSTFSPDFRIEPATGKFFETSNDAFKHLRSQSYMESYSEVLEDKVLVQYNGLQIVGMVKGIEPQSLSLHTDENMLYAGKYALYSDQTAFAIIGAQIQSNLQIPLQSINNAIQLITPRKGNVNSANPMDDVTIRRIAVGGVLTYQPGFDDLIIIPIDSAKSLLNEYDKISAVEINLKDDQLQHTIQKQIEADLGENYLIKNREQQNPTLYKTVQSEKWIVFFIVTLIGVIAIFNIIGSLTMLVLDKKKDMLVLKSLGAENKLIHNIFFIEGVLIALLGSVGGIVLGLAFCLLQEYFGLITTGGSNAIFDAYPIDIRIMDFIIVFLTVMIVSTIVSYLASKLSVREIEKEAIQAVD